METSEKNTRMHLGRKVSRIRELRGMKQETLAMELGVSQQTISKLEQSSEIEDSTLEKIAAAFGLPTEAIRNFNEEAVFNIIGNTFTDSSSNNNNYLCTINPLEKIIELYERLLASEKEKNDLLRKR
ncbi:helix-turn-helix domain-containing protein [Pedobacter soli]|uniref:DNA-binding transcriptional regulator, XRE-family HTH domain n=1 Tax=Pedobacter soli TaxID=390242 RepID=A0A1G6LHQ0_9SPHI|nr:helix-turn-helix transcriptional regulator [Pedobacter soli]SDC42761.1 DNA-binding transcriptional regulator, XRE-family HTH domain [Pedobacter soli]